MVCFLVVVIISDSKKGEFTQFFTISVNFILLSDDRKNEGTFPASVFSGMYAYGK